MPVLARWVVCVAAVGLALTGCAAGDVGMEEEAVPLPDTVATEPGREIIRTADMALRVDDVRVAVDRVDSITSQAGGRVTREDVRVTGDSLLAELTARVPADRLDSVVTAVSDLGEVTSLSIVADDVTAQGADLDARIAALETSVLRLRQLLAGATTTKDLIEIEGELTARQADLDSLVAQRAALSDLVALSTLNVTVGPSVTAAEWTPPGFVSGLQSGWNAFQTVVDALVTAAGFLLPFVIAGAIVAGIVVLLIVAMRRRRGGTTVNSPDRGEQS
jgi:hypothetical protein